MLQKKAWKPCWLPVLRLNVFTQILMLALTSSAVQAQGVDPLAQQMADQRVEFERIDVLRRLQEISAAEYQERRKQWNSAVIEIRAQIAKQPRDQQAQIMQQSESLFQVRIVPLREEWRQKLIEKQQSDTSRNAQIQRELVTDAEKAGKFQAARALLREKQQRGEISQAELERHDQVAEQEVLALQRKYDGYGGNWGRIFSQHVASSAQKVAAEVRLKVRLENTQSEIGQDAHRAAELNLSIQRNAVLRMKQAITRQQEEEQDATLKAQLAVIEAKYGAGSPTAPDFRDRVGRLVPAGVNERRAQWESEADAARAALTRNARANVAPATPAHRRPQPSSVPAQTHSTDYLREMPSAERVLADIRGKNRLDTAQRQIAALMGLDHMIALMQAGGEFGRGTAEEQALRGSYRGAIPPINATFDPVESKRLHLYWQDQTLEGSSDKTIERELFNRYFSPGWQAKYLGVKANLAAEREAREANQARARGEWTRQEKEQLEVVFIAAAAYMVFLIVLMRVSFRGHFELDRSDSHKLILGPARYKLYSTTGTVLNPTKDREVQIHVSGGGSHPTGGLQPITSSTTTITHVQFFIKEAGGAERAIQLTDVDLALRDGQMLSAVWAIKDGEQSGYYLLFRNHSTQRIDFVNAAFSKLLEIKKWPVLLFSLPFLFLPFIPYHFVRQHVIAKRMRHVKQQISEQLIPQLDAEAKAI